MNPLKKVNHTFYIVSLLSRSHLHDGIFLTALHRCTNRTAVDELCICYIHSRYTSVPGDEEIATMATYGGVAMLPLTRLVRKVEVSGR